MGERSWVDDRRNWGSCRNARTHSSRSRRFATSVVSRFTIRCSLQPPNISPGIEQSAGERALDRPRLPVIRSSLPEARESFNLR
jgi:hypothetical protein